MYPIFLKARLQGCKITGFKKLTEPVAPALSVADPASTDEDRTITELPHEIEIGKKLAVQRAMELREMRAEIEKVKADKQKIEAEKLSIEKDKLASEEKLGKDLQVLTDKVVGVNEQFAAEEIACNEQKGLVNSLAMLGGYLLHTGPCSIRKNLSAMKPGYDPVIHDSATIAFEKLRKDILNLRENLASVLLGDNIVWARFLGDFCYKERAWHPRKHPMTNMNFGMDSSRESVKVEEEQSSTYKTEEIDPQEDSDDEVEEEENKEMASINKNNRQKHPSHLEH
ncbi:hypothetical protein BGAL_0072g00080 [Botrytis galanthina]|uniref:Uncharacterized protein n=1 Tax=Botrytis galanthina TaxID=278940 RepID=A0A4S8R6Z4_9HELO|nr:hypothetical protein BGAL_0072g00080 [Botrytis galanthina]